MQTAKVNVLYVMGQFSQLQEHIEKDCFLYTLKVNVNMYPSSHKMLSLKFNKCQVSFPRHKISFLLLSPSFIYPF